MGYRLQFELVISDVAAAAVGKYKMNISQIACEAVFEALAAKIEAENALELEHNAELREQVRTLQGQVKAARLVHRHVMPVIL